MKVTADTNVLVRMAVRDDLQQAEAALHLLREAAVVAVPLPVLCEFAWVLTRVYKFQRAWIAQAIRALVESANVVTERRAVEAGLALLDAGGDFADGVIAFQGIALGGETFASFDKDAVERLGKQGVKVRLVV